MAKIIALLSHIYQAAVALGLLLAISHLLEKTDYTVYSFFISTSQFVAIFAFEWIRSACGRFYPGLTPESEAVQRRVLKQEFIFCAFVCLTVAFALLLFGVPLLTALVGCGAAVMQGGTDLHLTMVRFRLQFQLFSRLQTVRATLCAAGTLLGLLVCRRFEGAALGLLSGYAAYVGLATLMSRQQAFLPGHWNRQVSRQHLVYGSVTGSSSTVSMLSALALKSILTALLGAKEAAGAMLALDLLQRPFALIFGALYAIQFPELVALYDRVGSKLALGRHLGRYYALLISASLMTAAGIFAVLRPLSALLIAPDLQAAFLRTAPLVIIASLLRGMTQNMMPTAAQLRRHLLSMFLLAALDCAFVNAGAMAGAWIVGFSDQAILSGATIGAAIAAGVGTRMLRSVPFEMTWDAVALSAGGLTISIAAYLLPLSNMYITALIAIVGGGGLSLTALIRLFEVMRKPSSVNSV